MTLRTPTTGPLRVLLPFLLMVAALVATHAQGPDPLDGQRYYPERVAADLEIWRTTLHEAHADPYRYVTKAALDRAIDEAIAGARVPLTAAEVAALVNPVLQLIGDAHTVVQLPPAVETALRQRVPLLPLAVRAVGGDLFVEEELKGFRTIPSGSRILSINGRSAASILDTLATLAIADGNDTLFRIRQVERDLPYLLYRYLDRSRTFTITFEPPGGRVRTERVVGLTGEEVRAFVRSDEGPLLPWSATNHADHHTTWLTLRHFHTDSLLQAGIRPERLVEELRRDLKRNRSRVLVIDVRGAAGGELALAELVHSIYALKPYRVVQDMTVRVQAPPTHYGLCDDLSEFFATLHATYLPGDHGRLHLRPDDPRLEQMEPRPNAFDGKVYVVCDALTCEAAAALVMMAGRAGRASIVGEEVGTNSMSSCGGRILQLRAPNTGLLFRIPMIRYVYEGTPRGTPDQGERPDHAFAVDARALATGRDLLRDALMEMILELQ